MKSTWSRDDKVYFVLVKYLQERNEPLCKFGSGCVSLLFEFISDFSCFCSINSLKD